MSDAGDVFIKWEVRGLRGMVWMPDSVLPWWRVRSLRLSLCPCRWLSSTSRLALCNDRTESHRSSGGGLCPPRTRFDNQPLGGVVERFDFLEALMPRGVAPDGRAVPPMHLCVNGLVPQLFCRRLNRHFRGEV